VNFPRNISGGRRASTGAAIRIVGSLFSYGGLRPAGSVERVAQAQEPVAFGLSIVKPMLIDGVPKSIVAHMRVRRDILSVTKPTLPNHSTTSPSNEAVD